VLLILFGHGCVFVSLTVVLSVLCHGLLFFCRIHGFVYVVGRAVFVFFLCFVCLSVCLFVSFFSCSALVFFGVRSVVLSHMCVLCSFLWCVLPWRRMEGGGGGGGGVSRQM